MKRTVPVSFVTTRAITLAGTAYAVGATVPAAVVGSLPRVDHLISRGVLVPTPDQFGTRARKALSALHRRQPTHYSPTELKAIKAEST